MATFKYSARDAAGRVVAGAIDAETEVMVIGKLQEMGFFVTSLEKQAGRGAGLSIGMLRGLRRVGLRELTVFARQFATMVNAGLSMVRTLSILEQQTESQKLRQIIGEVRNEAEEGMTLSDAFGKHPETFNPLIGNMVRACEAGGLLHALPCRLATYFAEPLT